MRARSNQRTRATATGGGGSPTHPWAARLRCCALLSIFSVTLPGSIRADVLFVDDDAGGAGNGSSWADAFTELQAALLAATAGDEIWVAVGRYLPDFDVFGGRHTGDREASFVLRNGVALYGGFAGTESTLRLRAGLFLDTVLSGDLADNDDDGEREENSLHIVFADEVNATAVLDGFAVAGGFSDGAGVPDGTGGGLLLFSASPSISHCSFVDNFAQTFGGGIAGFSSDPMVTQCAFYGNVAVSRGGGINFQTNSQPQFWDCRFSENFSERGGAIGSIDSEVLVVHGRFVGNVASEGGGVFCSQDNSPSIVNCIFAGNEAITGGGLASFGSSPAIAGCVFSGNRATSSAALDFGKPAAAHIRQCTVVSNAAGVSAGGLGSAGGATIANSIFWGNSDNGGANQDESAQIRDAAGDTLVQHSLVQNLDVFAADPGNIDGNPLFAGGPTGQWSAAASYEHAVGLTTLTDSGADWTPGELVGHVLNPDTSQVRHTVIAGNTATQLMVLGDFVTQGAAGNAYAIMDYRLTLPSPAIDAGNNAAMPPDLADLDADGDALEAQPFDLAGLSRTVDIVKIQDCSQSPGSCGQAPVVDIGAFELQNAPAEGVITASDPPDGAIDARQPTDLNGTHRAGWDSITLTFSGDPSAVTVDAFDISASGGKTPAIQTLLIDGRTVTVVLDGPITPGTCTALLHPASASRVELGFLPGDVSNDGTSAPLDILDLVDGLNGVISLEAWRCNIDRSGLCGPLDILRLVDLLNGAGAYESWNGADLPPCPR